MMYQIIASLKEDHSISEMCARLAYIGKIDTVCHPCDMVAERENIIYLRDLEIFLRRKHIRHTPIYHRVVSRPPKHGRDHPLTWHTFQKCEMIINFVINCKFKLFYLFSHYSYTVCGVQWLLYVDISSADICLLQWKSLDKLLSKWGNKKMLFIPQTVQEYRVYQSGKIVITTWTRSFLKAFFLNKLEIII
jgi:hypothetical protein